MKPRLFPRPKELITLLAEHLHNAGVKYVRITGKESPEHRGLAIRAFQEDEEVTACIGTIQAMGEGVTLTAASTVVLVDRWWSPAVNDQAVDRLHRPGQHDSVNVISLVAEDSFDSAIEDILSKKKGFAAETDVAKEALIARRAAKRR